MYQYFKNVNGTLWMGETFSMSFPPSMYPVGTSVTMQEPSGGYFVTVVAGQPLAGGPSYSTAITGEMPSDVTASPGNTVFNIGGGFVGIGGVDPGDDINLSPGGTAIYTDPDTGDQMTASVDDSGDLSVTDDTTGDVTDYGDCLDAAFDIGSIIISCI